MSEQLIEKPTSNETEPVVPADHSKELAVCALDGYTLAEETEYHPLPDIEAGLKDRIVGQSEAIEDITRALARAELRDPEGHRPVANLLFCGPNGVGKTELAKTLSVLLQADSDGVKPSFTKIDCPSYSHPQPQMAGMDMPSTDSSPDLIEPIFSKKSIEQKNSVVLFDRLEGSPVELTRLIRTIMSDGLIKVAGSNEVVSFRDAIVILNYNVTPQEVKNKTGFSLDIAPPTVRSAAEDAIAVLKERVTAKFMSNFDETIFFDSLNDGQMVDVLHTHAKQAHERKPGRANVKVEISPKLAGAIVVTNDQRKQYGAQSVINQYEVLVESTLVNQIIAGNVPHNSTAYCDLIFVDNNGSMSPNVSIHYKLDDSENINDAEESETSSVQAKITDVSTSYTFN